MDTVFTVQNYVILGLAMLGLATIAVIILVFMLSQQLRKGEFHTLSQIGACFIPKNKPGEGLIRISSNCRTVLVRHSVRKSAFSIRLPAREN